MTPTLQRGTPAPPSFNPDVDNRSGFNCLEGRSDLRGKGEDARWAIRGGSDHDNPDASEGDILLILQVPVGRYQGAEAVGRCQSQQLAVLGAGPAHLGDGSDLVSDDGARKPPWQRLIEEDEHRGPVA